MGSIPDRVIPKTQRKVLDSALLNTQHYKKRIKCQVEQSRKWSSAPLPLDVVAIEEGAFGSPSSKVDNFTYLFHAFAYCKKMAITWCSILTSDPAKHAIPKTAEVLYSVGVGELG